MPGSPVIACTPLGQCVLAHLFSPEHYAIGLKGNPMLSKSESVAARDAGRETLSKREVAFLQIG